MNRPSEWIHSRTCSRSPYECDNGHDAKFGHWTRRVDGKTETLCHDCYDKVYQPKEYAKRQAELKAAEKRRHDLMAQARAGKIPEGWTYKGGVLRGPTQYWFGVPCHEIIGEPLYDTESFAPPPVDMPKIDFFQWFKDLKPPT